MRWVWAIRLMFVAACALAFLEGEGIIHPPALGLAGLVVLLTIHFAMVVRIARRQR